MEQELYTWAEQVGHNLLARGWTLVTAESCTGGGVAQALTAIPGSSQWFERGWVTYSNLAKQELLGVRDITLASHGAVSAETVAEMALGALARSPANMSIAISGIAGPGGALPNKSVGTVWLAWALRDGALFTAQHHFLGDRAAVRQQAVSAALQGVSVILQQVQ